MFTQKAGRPTETTASLIGAVMAKKDMQERFIKQYKLDPDINPTQAAIRAGYSKKTASAQASRLLKNVKVLTEINRIKSEVNSKAAELAVRSKADVHSDIVRRGKKAEAAGNFSAALKASELEGKIMGMFTDKVELSGNADSPIEIKSAIDIKGLTDEQLMQLLEGKK